MIPFPIRMVRLKSLDISEVKKAAYHLYCTIHTYKVLPNKFLGTVTSNQFL